MAALWPGMPGYEEAIQSVIAEVNPPRTREQAKRVLAGRTGHATRKVRKNTDARGKHAKKVKAGLRQYSTRKNKHRGTLP
jgi:hypothetical protein